VLNLNWTHDPRRMSFVASANSPDADFPIQNLPYGIFDTPGTSRRAGVAIGDQILDLALIETTGLVKASDEGPVFGTADLNAFMALGPQAWSKVRQTVSGLLASDNATLRDNVELRQHALIPMAAARMHLPVFVRSYTDFYASREHATNVGTLFRDPANALPPNWLHIPIGYNGRASTVVISGTDIRRPLGQHKLPGAETPSFGPSRKLDIELELGAIVGIPNRMGEPVSVAQAWEMIFGYVLMNDWSARDIQAWEYQPLGPFQGKVFGTTISPWIVTREALEPFRVAPPERVKPLLPYLQEATPNNYDVHLEIALQPAGSPATVISRNNAKYLYYSAAQQLTHHAIGGCAMCTGDLLGSGTISGPEKGSFGSLLELTADGRTPILLADGTSHTFLEDEDTVILRGFCKAAGYKIGFGDCSGSIKPAPALPQTAL